jgi:CheY-like chemotaxis protein
MMPTRPKLLLLDDEQDLLDIYGEMLAKLPSQPEIHTVTTGSRALALLESEPFTVLISDLKMPKMDGLQVLSIVQRKFPQLRTVVLTSVLDEQFRSRAYALGVDLFWIKPSTEAETKQFLDCLESLISREQSGGFRGVQSKSLVDIIQLESLSQSSCSLKITNGPHVGQIWLINGEPVDAVVNDLYGEEAFQRILSWKTGTFETLPAEPSRPRTIMKSSHALLLEAAQTLDEQSAAASSQSSPADTSPLAVCRRQPGVEYAVAWPEGKPAHFETRGHDNPAQLASWGSDTLERFRDLGDRLRAGALERVLCRGPLGNVALAPVAGQELCLGWHHSRSTADMRTTTNEMVTQWAS